VFRPAIISAQSAVFFAEAERKQPIKVSAQDYVENSRIKLPEGFLVDELPEPVKADTAFGSYSAKYSVEGGELMFSRTLTLQHSTLPSTQYSAVRKFYERILAAEQAPVVLIRK
jgi:hypothetical protein